MFFNEKIILSDRPQPKLSDDDIVAKPQRQTRDIEAATS
jgi:hypothetical protein